MPSRSDTLIKVFGAAALVMTPWIAAAWLPPEFPLLMRQIILSVWGATLALERALFGTAWRRA